MACVLVPAAEAIIATAATKIAKNKEKEKGITEENVVASGEITWSKKLSWLSKLLWGGSALLGFEHFWHGEIIPVFPFLTAAANAEDAQVMLHEMSTVGVSMAVLLTCVWGVMLVVSKNLVKSDNKEGVVK